MKEIIKGFDKIIGIYSLSKRPDSVLMWSHYGKNHNGFVVGFDSEHPFFGRHRSHQYIDVLSEVIYSRNRIEVDVANPKNNKAEDTNKILITKNIEWEYEKEYRLIRKLDEAAAMGYPISKPPIFLFKIPCECIKSVIFGIDCSQETKSEIINLICSKDLSKRIKLYQALMDHKTYNVNKQEINT